MQELEPAVGDLGQSVPVLALQKHANINRGSTNSGCGNVWIHEGGNRELGPRPHKHSQRTTLARSCSDLILHDLCSCTWKIMGVTTQVY